MGSLWAFHSVNRPAAPAVGFAGEHERRVVEEINRLSLHLQPGDVTHRPPAGRQTPPLTRDERIDLRVRADRHDPAVRPDRRAGHEATQRRKRRDRQPLQWRGAVTVVSPCHALRDTRYNWTTPLRPLLT